jgi:hypothetical protein
VAKRFTDTELYDKAWFRKLPPRLKCAWEWLCKRCDLVGVWNIDMEKLSFEVGEEITLEDLESAFEVQVFDGDKLFLPGFVAFQYGDESGRLSPRNRFHLSVAAKLQVRGFARPEFKPLDSPPDPIVMGDDTHPTVLGSTQGQGKGQGKGKGQGQEEGGVGETNSFDFEALYRKYPRKEGKASGIKQCEDQIRTQEQYDSLSKAIDRYSEHCRRTEQIVKHFSSFIGTKRTGFPWRDWLEPDTGDGALPAGEGHSPKADLRHIFGEDEEATA